MPAPDHDAAPAPPGLRRVLIADSVTTLDSSASGSILVTGSHGGLTAGGLASAAQVAGAIFNDAGGGLDDAGIASLALFDRHDVPAATVSNMSARIGDAQDSLLRGVVSHANRAAAALGVTVGQSCRDAAAALRAGRALWLGPRIDEARFPIGRIADIDVWGLDSASLVRPEDAGRILIIGSHGGLPGGDPAKALKVEAYAAIFNDAGIGIDDAGVSRLPALDARSIAAATVDVWTARIGDARSSWTSGVISRLNTTAKRMGGETGQPIGEFVGTLTSARAATASLHA